MTGRIWLIAGPTASGKSALGLRLAELVGGEIVNADAMQVYGDLASLTARPGPQDLARAPHHLFGIADAADAWSAGRWLRAAQTTINQIQARGRNVVVVGGTGLYLRALTRGLAEIAPVAAEARAEASQRYAALGETEFRTRLAEVDPAAANRIAPGDRQRLVRAWEVYASTGRSLTDHQREAQGGLGDAAWRGAVLTPARAELYAHCDVRLETMLAMGALDEVAALLTRNLDPSLPILKAVGYREFAAHLGGKASLGEALAAARQATRNYAKRQLTWIRGQMADWPRIETLDPEAQWRQFLALNPDLTV